MYGHWKLTVPERNNAALLLLHTTVRPFIFTGHSFKCFYCQLYDSDIKIVMDHIASHTITDLDIILNKYVHKSKMNLQADIADLRCRNCDDKFSSLNCVKKHLLSDHKVEFSKSGDGITEYIMALKNGMFVCHICRSEFHNFNLLNSHMNFHVAKVVCENCGAGFSNQKFLQKHKETHSDVKLKCQFCDKTFSKTSQLKYHTDIVHKGKPRVTLKKCPKCPETFKEHYSKLKHLKTVHGIVKTFECYLCKAKFNLRKQLTEHITKTHTEKFKCDLCLKRFSIESKLRTHMKSHTGERNFLCPVCNNAYMHQRTLRKHIIRIHNQTAEGATETIAKIYAPDKLGTTKDEC